MKWWWWCTFHISLRGIPILVTRTDQALRLDIGHDWLDVVVHDAQILTFVELVVRALFHISIHDVHVGGVRGRGEIRFRVLRLYRIRISVHFYLKQAY